jgi:hypothetical protein
MRFAITLDLFAVLVGGGVALLPIYAREIVHVGPVGLGVLRAAPAIGALGAALILARRPLRHAAGPTLITVVVLFGGDRDGVVAGGIATIGIAVASIKVFPELARMGRLEELRPQPAGNLAV